MAQTYAKDQVLKSFTEFYWAMVEVCNQSVSFHDDQDRMLINWLQAAKLEESALYYRLRLENFYRYQETKAPNEVIDRAAWLANQISQQAFQSDVYKAHGATPNDKGLTPIFFGCVVPANLLVEIFNYVSWMASRTDNPYSIVRYHDWKGRGQTCPRWN